MSGYFAQLAALTLGRTAAIRPAGTSRYAAPEYREAPADGAVARSTIESSNAAIEPVNAAIEPANGGIESVNGAIESVNGATEPSDDAIEAGARAIVRTEGAIQRTRDEGGQSRVAASTEDVQPMAPEQDVHAAAVVMREAVESNAASRALAGDAPVPARLLGDERPADEPPRSHKSAAVQIAPPARERPIGEAQSDALVATTLLAAPRAALEPERAVQRAAVRAPERVRVPDADESRTAGRAAEHAETPPQKKALDDVQSPAARLVPLADVSHAAAVRRAGVNRAPQEASTRRGFDAVASRARADEPADVYVHIGRIDVRAVTAPERRPVPPPRPASQKHSLAAYLRARDAGRP